MLRDHAESQLVVAIMRTVKIVLHAFCPKWPPVTKEKKHEQPDQQQQRLNDVVRYTFFKRETKYFKFKMRTRGNSIKEFQKSGTLSDQ